METPKFYRVSNIFNTNKKCFTKINVESSPQKIWISIIFLKKKTDPYHWEELNITLILNSDLFLYIKKIEQKGMTKNHDFGYSLPS